MTSQIAALMHKIKAEAIDFSNAVDFFEGCFQCLLIRSFQELIVVP
jgi:hypothetical protein